MELFDIIKVAFKKGQEWDKVSKNDKTRNFFMINRIFSINFPIQANQFNHTKVAPRPVVDWWHDTLSSHYSKSPSWIFTKTKKSESKKSKEFDWEKYSEAEAFVRSKFEISKREIAEMKKFFPDKYLVWIESIDVQYKSMTNKDNEKGA
jgi:hypothetical protein